jgi:hypothetical protein
MLKQFSAYSKQLFFSLLLLLLITANSSTIFAAKPAIDLPASATSSNLFFGQKHSYSVFFRGNGEGIVLARVALKNLEENSLSKFDFEVLNASTAEMVAYQQVISPTCARYDYTKNQECLQYTEADYFSDYGYAYGSTTKYNKLKINQAGSNFSVEFPDAIATNSSTALIIAYSSKSYVKESVGLYKYTFETLKVNQRVSSSSVAIDVDEDLYLKDRKSTVNYGTSDSFGKALGSSASSVASPELDSVSRNIGNYGALIKDTKNLAPNETFTVKGEYSRNWWRLYLSSILITLFIVALITVGAVLLSKYLKKRFVGDASQKAKGSAVSHVPFSPFSLAYIFNGFVSAFLVVLLTIFVQYLSRSSIFYSTSGAFFELILVILVLIAYFLVIFGPAIVVGIKHGFTGFLLTMVSVFGWLILFSVLYVILFQSGVLNGFLVHPVYSDSRVMY